MRPAADSLYAHALLLALTLSLSRDQISKQNLTWMQQADCAFLCFLLQLRKGSGLPKPLHFVGQQSKGGQPCSRPPHCSTVTSSALNGQPMLRPARGHATSSFQPVDNQSLKRHRLSGAPAAPSCSPRPGQPTPVWHGMSRAHSPPHKNSGPKRPPGQPAQPNSSRWAEYTAHAEPELTSTNELAAKTVKHAWGQQCSGQVDSEVVLLVTSLD